MSIATRASIDPLRYAVVRVLGCVVLVAAAAACGVRTPAPIDVGALVQKQGALAARHELELRVVRHPKDVAARLALAALDDQLARPSAAIEQLEAVVALGGPLGTRWHADDRARLARLLAARGKARLARDAASAVDDLARARTLGATVDDVLLARARLARARSLLRHADAEQRAAGIAIIVGLAATPLAQSAWRGAAPGASAADRGAFGAWLWSIGARRAAWDALSAWHDALAAPRDPALQASYLIALAWWSPPDAPPPPAIDLVGPARCRFAGPTPDGCAPSQLAPEDAVLLPVTSTREPADAAAWLAITLQQALRGEGAWGPALAARIDTAAVAPAALPPAVRAAYARLTGRGDAGDVAAGDRDRLVAAAGRALAGASADELRTTLGPLAASDEGKTLVQIAASTTPLHIARPHAIAAVTYARARMPFGPTWDELRAIVDGYYRDPAVAERLAGDAVATAVDAAAANAALGALYDALGDPARARTAWQAAVDASPEPEFLLGLAAAMARASDPDACLVVGTAGAAATGDPAVAWTAVARALEDAGHHVHALEAARNAIDLASTETQAAPLDIAAAASRALGRTAQADRLAAQRTRLPPAAATSRTDDPTDVDAALAAHRAHPTAATAARLWVASRWNPRDVAARAALLDALGPDDARRNLLTTELVALAADRDPARARAAVAALR